MECVDAYSLTLVQSHDVTNAQEGVLFAHEVELDFWPSRLDIDRVDAIESNKLKDFHQYDCVFPVTDV